MSAEPAGALPSPSRNAARVLAGARLALRLAIKTHKRSIAAHRRSMLELKGAVDALEQECEALGLDLVLDNAEPTQGGHSNEQPATTRLLR